MADDIVTPLLALNHPDAAVAAVEIERLRKELAMLRIEHVLKEDGHE
jgi:hypothetical protein